MNGIITTDKEAFEFISEFLLKQNSQAKGSSGECVYRSYNITNMSEFTDSLSDEDFEEIFHSSEDFDTGEVDLYELYELQRKFKKFYFTPQIEEKKCAVGCIISDDVYGTHLEQKDILDDDVLEAVIESNSNWKMTYASAVMLKELQSVHDTLVVSSWKDAFEKFHFDSHGRYIVENDSYVRNVKNMSQFKEDTGE